MPDAVVTVAGRPDSLSIQINGPNPTFRLETDAIEAVALKALDPVILDLVEVAAAVFAADGSVRRGSDSRPGMGSAWRRRYHFEIAVREPDLWNSPKVMSALVDAVHVLTDDDVSFRFIANTDPARGQRYLQLSPDGASFEADEVILFSGGLDSFAGALEVLSSTSTKVILVTHRSAQKVIPRQVELGRFLQDRFHGRVLHVNVLARRKGQQASDTTQRSRSLLFAALGQAVAHSFGARRVNFFENGVVSHNLPLSPLIVGTMATRTTHPLALEKLQHLIRCVLPEAVPIENRFQWLTKTEVVARIGQHGAAEQIVRAVSCTSVREQDSLRTHCGACTQCLDRRFAVLAAGLDRHDPSEIYLTDVLLGARGTDHSSTMAVEWTRHCLRMGDHDETMLLGTFGLEVARILQAYPDLDRREALRMTRDLHHRQSDVVERVLTDAAQRHAAALVGQRLPSTSLLCLHLGNGRTPADIIPTRAHVIGQPALPAGADPERDLVPDAKAPLRVAFWSVGGQPVVAVEGLGRVTGRHVHVPHGLRHVYEEDLATTEDREAHRFVAAARIVGLEAWSKDAVRKAVARCRKSLAADYERLHGHPPASPLLIETGQPQGYRLDPTIEVIPPEGLA